MRRRKAAAVLESARTLFLDEGFDATSVDRIAAGAGVSKATVYSNFADKPALLTALVESVTQESAVILARAVQPLDADGPVEERLIEAAMALAGGVLRPEVVGLRRLAIGESTRHPDIARTYFERGPAATLRLLTEAFARLGVTDAAAAADQFAYAVIGPLQDRALLAGAALDEAAIRAHVHSTVGAFVRAHGEALRLASDRRP
ncbi:TetR/AcrR family transcriptional regulator [Amnibacterium sp.]|uniref:TetR/AcrR family transcriptional regulator n=1 Tax=Amnibacterium sp. TaxID=1872496 RepID=UPI002609E506|nr:TetR/AcrR family transcriptional regulator [Amnibacterium sp.]MCU1472851.1 TetR/AcrR family transcriptional regulator [Amnibacterium sp.]